MLFIMLAMVYEDKYINIKNKMISGNQSMSISA